MSVTLPTFTSPTTAIRKRRGDPSATDHAGQGYPYVFRFDGIGAPDFWLPVPPSAVQMRFPERLSPMQTKSGNYAETWGAGMVQVALQGSMGWAVNARYGLTGHDTFARFVSFWEQRMQRIREGNPENYLIIFTSIQEQAQYRVVMPDFTFIKDQTSPLLDRYQMTLYAVEVLQLFGPRASTSSTFFADAFGGGNAPPPPQSVTSATQAVSAATTPEVNAALSAFAASAAPGTTAASALTSGTNDYSGAIISAYAANATAIPILLAAIAPANGLGGDVTAKTATGAGDLKVPPIEAIVAPLVARRPHGAPIVAMIAATTAIGADASSPAVTGGVTRVPVATGGDQTRPATWQIVPPVSEAGVVASSGDGLYRPPEDAAAARIASALAAIGAAAPVVSAVTISSPPTLGVLDRLPTQVSDIPLSPATQTAIARYHVGNALTGQGIAPFVRPSPLMPSGAPTPGNDGGVTPQPNASAPLLIADPNATVWTPLPDTALGAQEG